MSEMNLEKWTIMHKDIPVVDVLLTKETGAIVDILKVHDFLRLPYSAISQGKTTPGKIDYWFQNRVIPASRDNLKEILEKNKISQR